MTQWIINYNENIIPRRTVKKLMAENLSPINEVEKSKRRTFDKKFVSILGDSIDLPPVAPDPKFLSENDDEVIYNLGPSIFDGG